MYPERFWQVFLAASLNEKRAGEFFQTLRPSDSDPTEIFVSWPKLTEEEKARVRLASSNKISQFRVLTPDDYPETLKRVPKVPQALFTHGDPDCLHRPTIGIVGTRRATTQGKAIAQKFAEHLALAGFTIVSGGAFGIDAAAHAGALAVGRPTACILPCGVDVAQPPRHADLFKKIAETGCLVSQFACGMPSRNDTPLLRNAVIAGLSDAVLVVEAPLPSGSLNTATHAAHLNRPLYVVPGSISAENYRGSHQLIREGATLVDHPGQIIEDFNLPTMESPVETQAAPVQAQILEMLDSEAIPLELISEETGLAVHDLLSELTMMEMDGLVVKHAGGYARRIR